MTASLTPPRADGAAHLDDAALLRALDGERITEDGDAAASARAAAHLAACPVCVARTERLRTRRARLSTLLSATDVSVPVVRPVVARSVVLRPSRATHPFTHPAARLAAAGVLVAATGLAAQPVRRWVADHWAQAVGAPPRRARATGTGPRAVADTARLSGATSVVVSFTPEPGPFTLHFDTRPAGGTLTVRVAHGPRASATANPGGGEHPGDFVVLPAGLRVRNAAAPHGDYDLAVPAGTARLHVVFDAPAADTVLSLTGRTPIVLALHAP